MYSIDISIVSLSGNFFVSIFFYVECITLTVFSVNVCYSELIHILNVYFVYELLLYRYKLIYYNKL